MTFCYPWYGDHRHLHSFPTRRSSDLTSDVTVDLSALAAEAEQPNDVLADREYGPLGKLDALELAGYGYRWIRRSEEHTSELQSRLHLVCRLLLEKKKKREPPSLTLVI